MKYDGAWWSVDIPAEWEANTAGSCSTFNANPEIGALQISAARKDTDLVAVEDLAEFALARIPVEAPIRSVVCGDFSGFTTSYQNGSDWWQEWWLKSGRLMIYATYITDVGSKDIESAAVGAILSSLKIKDAITA